MDLFSVFQICVGASVALATPDRWLLSDVDLAINPLIRQLLDRVDLLEQQGVKQASEIHALKIEMSQQRTYMKRLHSKLYAKDKLIQALLVKAGKRALEEDSTSDGTKRHDNPLMQHLDRLKVETKRSKQIRGAVNRIQPVENIPVAFSASLTQIMVLGNAQLNFVFDHVDLNAGNAYKPNQGVFIAPVPGIYVFTTTLLPYGASSAYMTVNQELKSKIHLNAASPETACQTMVFELNEGDTVAIQGSSGDVYPPTFPPSTTFSGFLLKQTYPSIVMGAQTVG